MVSFTAYNTHSLIQCNGILCKEMCSLISCLVPCQLIGNSVTYIETSAAWFGYAQFILSSTCSTRTYIHTLYMHNIYICMRTMYVFIEMHHVLGFKLQCYVCVFVCLCVGYMCLCVCGCVYVLVCVC